MSFAGARSALLSGEHGAVLRPAAGKLVSPQLREVSVDETCNPPPVDRDDLESLYESFSSSTPAGRTVVLQQVHKIQKVDSLFYADAHVSEGVVLKAMIDSGSMSCSLSEAAAERVLEHHSDLKQFPADDLVVVGAGGHQVTPTAVYDFKLKVYGFPLQVPALVIPGQKEDMILGSNAIKVLMRLMKSSDSYWDLLAKPVDVVDGDGHEFLSLLSNVEKWKDGPMPDKIGTVKLRQSVTLEPLREHLVWGKLPASAPISVGSTVVVEATKSRSGPRNVLVGRVVAPLWGDRWVPVKVINPSNEQVTLRRNSKIADVSPCVAVEELALPDRVCVNIQDVGQGSKAVRSPQELKEVLEKLELQDLALEACEVSDLWMDKLLHLIEMSFPNSFYRVVIGAGATGAWHL